ncbi:phosphoenolpyruvate carboxykinase (ATP), partial [Francisella tularensis subsp. holarctica]|nr:phosphoenolpyruvate carboxykinase (ATP) [Francisella tularensis subsp. holarctica]
TSKNDNGQELQLTNKWSDSAEYKKEYKSLARSFIKNYEQFENDDFALKYKKYEPII